MLEYSPIKTDLPDRGCVILPLMCVALWGIAGVNRNTCITRTTLPSKAVHAWITAAAGSETSRGLLRRAHARADQGKDATAHEGPSFFRTKIANCGSIVNGISGLTFPACETPKRNDTDVYSGFVALAAHVFHCTSISLFKEMILIYEIHKSNFKKKY